MSSSLDPLFYHARQARDFFFDLLFPLECLDCSEEGVWLCDKCFRKIPYNSNHYCLNCKKANQYGEFCPDCALDFSLDGVWIAGNYNNKILISLIKNLKYYYAQNLADTLGAYLSLFLKDLLGKNRLLGIGYGRTETGRQFNKAGQCPLAILNFSEIIVMPVPLHKKRYLLRGFNQADKLAQVICENFNLTINHGLIRIKHKKPQVKLKKKARKQNIINCFAYWGNDLKGKNILLVDDVTTTGATLNECARILKKHNAGEIWGLVAANG